MVHVWKMWALMALAVVFSGIFDWHPLFTAMAGMFFGAAVTMTAVTKTLIKKETD